MKLTTISQTVEAIIENGICLRDDEDMDNLHLKIVANEAVIYWKTFFIAEQHGIDKAMEYFKGTHSDDEYQEFRTGVVDPRDDSTDASPQDKLREKPETFEHMLTVIMIGFGDARELENSEDVADRNRAELEIDEEFGYAQDWLREHNEALINSEVCQVLDRLEQRSEVLNDDVVPIYSVRTEAIEAERRKYE